MILEFSFILTHASFECLESQNKLSANFIEQQKKGSERSNIFLSYN